MVLRETPAVRAMSTIVAFCRPCLPKHTYADSTMSSRVSVAVACVMVPLGSRRENQPAGGHAGSRRDQDVLDVVDLVVGGPAHLPHALGDAVHAVDVGLAE